MEKSFINNISHFYNTILSADKKRKEEKVLVRALLRGRLRPRINQAIIAVSVLMAIAILLNPVSAAFYARVRIRQSQGVTAEGTITFTRNGSSVGWTTVKCTGTTETYTIATTASPNDIEWNIHIHWGDGHEEDWAGAGAWPGTYKRTHAHSPELEVVLEPPPVGGVTAPVDKATLLAPYISLAVAVAVATVGIAYSRKRWFGKAIAPYP